MEGTYNASGNGEFRPEIVGNMVRFKADGAIREVPIEEALTRLLPEAYSSQARMREAADIRKSSQAELEKLRNESKQALERLQKMDSLAQRMMTGNATQDEYIELMTLMGFNLGSAARSWEQAQAARGPRTPQRLQNNNVFDGDDEDDDFDDTPRGSGLSQEDLEALAEWKQVRKQFREKGLDPVKSLDILRNDAIDRSKGQLLSWAKDTLSKDPEIKTLLAKDEKGIFNKRLFQRIEQHVASRKPMTVDDLEQFKSELRDELQVFRSAYAPQPNRTAEMSRYAAAPSQPAPYGEPMSKPDRSKFASEEDYLNAAFAWSASVEDAQHG